MPKGRVIAVGVLVVIGLALVAGAEPILEIPLGSTPSIDGRFIEAEWRDAATVAFFANGGTIDVQVHLKHDGVRLYVAFEYPENPDGELVIPEILIDPDNGKTEEWSADDWWFHVSAQNCEAQGSYDDYQRCGLARPYWSGRPNFRSSPNSVPLDAIEIDIPLSMLSLSTGEAFGLGLTVNAWPSDTRGYWPEDASIESPTTWGEAVFVDREIGRITFDSDRNGDVEIYVMNEDGGHQTRLTNSLGDDDAPAWSHDGTRIAFSSERMGNVSIYRMNADGSDERRLTTLGSTAGQPAWSPDDSRIALVCFPGADAEICLMNADGGAMRQLTHNETGDFEPAWLPDGEHIGFSSQLAGFADVYVMDANGENLVRLTDTEAHDAYPHWSPDGSRIVFCSNRDGNWEIYVMNADGTDQQRMTYSDGLDGGPKWSPDGTRIVFESNRDGDSEIYVMDADGGNVQQLTDNDAQDRRPQWQP